MPQPTEYEFAAMGYFVALVWAVLGIVAATCLALAMFIMAMIIIAPDLFAPLAWWR